MELDFLRFFDACDPSKTLAIANPEDRQYYIVFLFEQDLRITTRIFSPS